MIEDYTTVDERMTVSDGPHGGFPSLFYLTLLSEKISIIFGEIKYIPSAFFWQIVKASSLS
jgi:hypothetical protein